MKDDLISRRAAIEAAMKVIERDTSGKNVVVEAMKAWMVYIMELPSATVGPVKHGKWIPHEETTELSPGIKMTAKGYICSECGERFGNAWTWCGNCGARMERSEE